MAARTSAGIFQMFTFANKMAEQLIPALGLTRRSDPRAGLVHRLCVQVCQGGRNGVSLFIYLQKDYTT